MGDGHTFPVFVIIRGPLGAGKTTVARSLAQRIGPNARMISIDPLLDELEWDGGSETLFLTANLRAARLATESLTNGSSAVVEGNFYWPRVLEDLVRRVPAAARIFTLNTPLEVCIQRDRDRPQPYGEEATREVFARCAGNYPGLLVDGGLELESIVRSIVRSLEDPDHGPSPEGSTSLAPRSG